MTREEAIENLKGLLESNYVDSFEDAENEALRRAIVALEDESKIGHCKDCKHFEYDSVAKVDGVPLIVAHLICKRWGDGCKTKENGYCFLFEPQESEGA